MTCKRIQNRSQNSGNGRHRSKSRPPIQRSSSLLCAVGVVTTLAGGWSSTACTNKNEPAVEAPIDGSQPARRVTSSFLRCVELTGAACVKNAPEMAGWDAFATLSWLYEASPVAILGSFNAELSSHADFDRIQDRFVESTRRARPLIRGAGCEGGQGYAVETALERLLPALNARMEEIGLRDPSMVRAIHGLADEVRSQIPTGYIVTVDCAQMDNLKIFVAVSRSGERLEVLGLTHQVAAVAIDEKDPIVAVDALPERPTVLAQGRSSSIHPWIPISWEEF